MSTASKRADISTPPTIIDALPWVSNVGGLTIGGVCYPRGCRIPDDVVTGCQNFDALRINRRITQRHPSKIVETIQPIEIEPTPAALSFGNTVEVMRVTGDAIEDWELSIEATMGANSCPRGLARELLMGDRLGAELFKAATRLASERHAINRLNGRREAIAI